MTIRKIFSCFFVKNTKFHALLSSFQGYIREVITAYSNNPSIALQVIIISFAFIYVVAHGVLDVLGMLIFSILTCNIFSKVNLFFRNDLDVNLDYEKKKKIIRSRSNVTFFCIIFQFFMLAVYCPTPFTRSSFGEALLWTFITTTSIILHDLVRVFYQTLPKKSKIRFLLKNLTNQFIGNFIPLGSLLIYIIYLPYLCAYWVLYFSLEKVNDIVFSGILFSISLLIIMVSCIYYRLAIYLMRRVNSLTL